MSQDRIYLFLYKVIQFFTFFFFVNSYNELVQSSMATFTHRITGTSGTNKTFLKNAEELSLYFFYCIKLQIYSFLHARFQNNFQKSSEYTGFFFIKCAKTCAIKLKSASLNHICLTIYGMFHVRVEALQKFHNICRFLVH